MSEENITPEVSQEVAEEEIVDVEQEIVKLKDLLMRALAEAENTRKRAEKEKIDALKYAVSGFARDLLSVADNMRRALDCITSDTENLDPALKSMIDGINMTEAELLSTFNKHGIKKIAPEIGEQFNHDLHQAMFEVPTDEFEAGVIVQIAQPGYTLNDRLLRPAMVGVAKATA